MKYICDSRKNRLKLVAVLLVFTLLMSGCGKRTNDTDLDITVTPTSVPEELEDKPSPSPTEEPIVTVQPDMEPGEPTIQPDGLMPLAEQPGITFVSTKEPVVTKKPTPKPTRAPQPTKKPTKAPTPKPTKVPTPVPTKTQNLKGSLTDILDDIYDGVKSELPMIGTIEITKENSEFYLGIPKMDFVEAVASDALIMVVPYSVCLVRVSKGADVEAVKQQIIESAQPNKWICVGVDPKNVLVSSVGDVIMLAMTDLSKEITDSFLSLQKSGKAAEILTKIKTPDKNGLLFYKDYCSKTIGKYSKSSTEQLAKKINTIIEKYLKGQKNVYYSVIPDKSFYILNSDFSTDDYYKMFDTLQQKVKNATYVPIIYSLELSDYYKTDLHWRQEELFPVVQTLGSSMGFTVNEKSFKKNALKSYKGIYSKYMKGTPKETLYYLTSADTKASEVTIYEKKGKNSVYLLDKSKSDVPYNLFLGGPNPMVTITNKKLNNGKELIIFGDSFASSLAPLLTGAYEKITLIDLRFVMSSHLSKIIKFNGQDVLFLYNTAVINNSSMLK